MGKGGGSSAPAPIPQPDPSALAREQAKANRITQFTPFGNVIYGTLDPDTFQIPTAGGLPSSQPANQPAGVPQFITEKVLAGERPTGQYEQRATGRMIGGETGEEEEYEQVPIMEPFYNTITKPNPDYVAPTASIASPTTANNKVDPNAGQTPTLGYAGPSTGAPQGFVPSLDGDQSAMFVQPTAAQAEVLGNAEQAGISLSELGRNAASALPQSALNFEGLPNYVSGIDSSRMPNHIDAAQPRRVEDATFASAMRMLRPELEFGERRLDQDLANQGLPIGSEIAEDRIDRFNRQRNDLLTNAAFNAVSAGSAEQAKLFGQGLQSRNQALAEALQNAQMQNQARAVGFTERQAVRGNQFNELASLLGLNQVQPPGVNQFVSPGAVDVLGANNQALSAQLANQQAAANAAAQNRAASASNTNALLGLGGTLGAGAIMKCSKALKENMRPVGDILPRIAALPVKAWNYKGETQTHIGPYAEDFQRLFGVGNGREIHVIDAIGVLFLAVQELTHRLEAA